MKSNSTLVVLLALATLGAGAWGWREHQQAAVLEGQLQAEDATAASLQKQLADAQNRSRRLSDEIAALKGRSRANEVASDGSAPAAGTGRRGNGGFRAMINNPQFQKLMAVQQKAMLDNTYAALFKMLNLTPQQLDQFKNLMVQRQQAIMDAVQAARDQGINPRTDPQDFQQAVQQAEAAVDSQIQSQLGDTAYTQYQQYQQTLPQRTTATQLQQSLSYTGSPLSDDQASQLIQVLAQNTPANSGGNGGGGMFFGPGGGGFGMGGGGTGQISDQAITQAQSFLSAPQVQALQQMQQQQQARQQMQQLMRSSRAGN